MISRLRLFLLGILVGQILMFPYVIHLINTPRIVAMAISDKYYNHKDTQHFVIKDIPQGRILEINIASFETVNAEFHKLEPNDKGMVDGFYNPDTNRIWCVYDPLVLYHEIKHATEGDYHR